MEHLQLILVPIDNKHELQWEIVRYRDQVANYIKQVMEKLKLNLSFGWDYWLLLQDYKEDGDINNNMRYLYLYLGATETYSCSAMKCSMRLIVSIRWISTLKQCRKTHALPVRLWLSSGSMWTRNSNPGNAHVEVLTLITLIAQTLCFELRGMNLIDIWWARRVVRLR